MAFSSKPSIKNLLKSRKLKPNKLLGQNFLIDKSIIRKLINAADLKPQDIVLEIGPGLGVLTEELAKKAKKVIAVEKDQNLARILNEELRIKNVKIIQGDILKISNLQFSIFNKSPISNFKVVGNLPFYLTAPLIRQLLENTGVQPLQMVLVVQKEVAQRICSSPPNMSLLAVSVHLYSEPKIISYVSKKSFWPQPEVDAAIVKIRVKNKKMRTDKDLFFKIVKAGFSHPRKQLASNLSNNLGINKKIIGEWLLKNKINPTRRAETLSLKDWTNLTKSSLPGFNPGNSNKGRF